MPIEHGNILTEGGVFRKGYVEFDETIINVETCENEKTAGSDEGPYIIPGLIDIHTHGAVGSDFSDASPEQMQEMSLYYAKTALLRSSRRRSPFMTTRFPA